MIEELLGGAVASTSGQCQGRFTANCQEESCFKNQREFLSMIPTDHLFNVGLGRKPATTELPLLTFTYAPNAAVSEDRARSIPTGAIKIASTGQEQLEFWHESMTLALEKIHKGPRVTQLFTQRTILQTSTTDTVNSETNTFPTLREEFTKSSSSEALEPTKEEHSEAEGVFIRQKINDVILQSVHNDQKSFVDRPQYLKLQDFQTSTKPVKQMLQRFNDGQDYFDSSRQYKNSRNSFSSTSFLCPEFTPVDPSSRLDPTVQNQWTSIQRQRFCTDRQIETYFTSPDTLLASKYGGNS
uniref:Uncharacterized protein n=1 Tax=Romanomermis culicivorax TaxID=13658 RepID=A0A915JWR4_ROMCU